MASSVYALDGFELSSCPLSERQSVLLGAPGSHNDEERC